MAIHIAGHCTIHVLGEWGVLSNILHKDTAWAGTRSLLNWNAPQYIM